MLFSALSKPRLWPTDDLQEARLECVATLKSTRLKPASRTATESLPAAIDGVLTGRGVRPRTSPYR